MDVKNTRFLNLGAHDVKSFYSSFCRVKLQTEMHDIQVIVTTFAMFLEFLIFTISKAIKKKKKTHQKSEQE